VATVIVNANLELDIRALEFSSLYHGVSYSTKPTTFVANYGNGLFDAFQGVGLTYNANHQLTGGIVTGYLALLLGIPLLAMGGLHIPAVSIGAAARTVSLADDHAVISSALAGNDLIKGGKLNDYLEGFNGNDALVGNNGADTLRGDKGADVLIGGAGLDHEWGGGGNDFFVFDAPRSPANRDYIHDFGNVFGNNDAIGLENAVLPIPGKTGPLNPNYFYAGPAAHDADDHIIYSKATGNLVFDSNGNLPGGTTWLAVLLTRPTLTAADFVVV
jgi:Ca2+-binding RTX toxin-like protein